MDFKKSTIVLAAIISFFVFWGGAHLFRVSASSPYTSTTDALFSYIMPKLAQYIPKFSLFDRTFVDNRKLAPKSTASQNNTNAKTNPPAKATPPAPVTPPAPKVASENTNQKTDVAADAERTRAAQANESDKNNPENNPDASGVGALANNNGVPPSTDKHDKPTIENQINDWKNKILQNPTHAVMNDFVYEFESEKISSDIFYPVMEELVKESNSEILLLTLYGLYQVQSVNTLSFLIKHHEDYARFVPVKYNDAIKVYEKVEKLKILSMALSSSDSEVVLGVMPIVGKVGTQLTKTEWTADYSSQSEDHRDSRGPTSRRPKHEIIQVIKVLESLQDSKDHQIAMAARETLSEINYHPPETVSQSN